MQQILTKGATSQILTVTLRSATTGQRLTGKTYADVTINAHRQGASPSAYTPVTMTAGTWVSQGWVETSVAGVYQLGVRNADLASGADGCKISVTASGAIDKDIDVVLLDADLRNATSLGLSRLDAAMTSRSSHAAADVWAVGTRTLTGFGTLVADIWSYATRTLSAFGFSVAVSDKTGFKLASDGLPTMPTDWITAAGLSAAAVAKIEAALLNEGDGQALINAMVAAIDAADIDADELPALVGAWILNRVLAGNHDTAGTPGKILQDIVAKTVNLPVSPASAGDVTGARDLVLTAVGTPLQAIDYVEPDNAGIGDAVTAAGAAATAAGAAQTAAETAATAAAAAATESEVLAIIDTIKGAGWTTETLKAIFDKPGASITEEQITALALAVANATIAAIGEDGVSVSEILPAALAAVRTAVAGAVGQPDPNWSQSGKLSVYLGDRYGSEFGRPITRTYPLAAIPWIEERGVELWVLNGGRKAKLAGVAAISGDNVALTFGALGSDWGELKSGTDAVFQILQRFPDADGTELQSIEDGQCQLRMSIPRV